jgi:oligopeptide/dipeptide ABC transporter ATP-binding protein
MSDLLSLHDVTHVYGVRNPTFAIDNVSFSMPEEPTILNLVGESGCGKSTLARIILRLIVPTAGSVEYKGENVRALRGAGERRFLREVQAVFQDPYSAFNPIYRVQRVFDIAIARLGLVSSRSEAQGRIEESLKAVELDPNVLRKRPHQLSGGMRQRIMLARIHLIQPRLVIADEPVSMIDAGVRVNFLNILRDFRESSGISTLYITHDLSTAQYLGGQIIVLYRGRIAERGETSHVMAAPRHPYTQLLMSSLPVADPSRRWQDSLETTLETEVQRVATRERCLYAGRCGQATDLCWRIRPILSQVAEDAFVGAQEVACHSCN